MDSDLTGEREDKYRAIAETRIREAMEAGEFKNLRGVGQPVEIEENPFVPEDMRIGYHVLKQNGFKPDWMTQAEDIDTAIQEWRAMADRHFADVRERLLRVTTDSRAQQRLREEIAALKAQHARMTARHAKALDEINQKIHYFNAAVPSRSLQRPTFHREREMRDFAARLPAYLDY